VHCSHVTAQLWATVPPHTTSTHSGLHNQALATPHFNCTTSCQLHKLPDSPLPTSFCKAANSPAHDAKAMQPPAHIPTGRSATNWCAHTPLCPSAICTSISAS
jgi:hypothetical protein